MLSAKERNAADELQVLNLESEQERARLVDALRKLYDLLEEYAPSWYSPEHHERAESALLSAKTLASERGNGHC